MGGQLSNFVRTVKAQIFSGLYRDWAKTLWQSPPMTWAAAPRIDTGDLSRLSRIHGHTVPKKVPLVSSLDHRSQRVSVLPREPPAVRIAGSFGGSTGVGCRRVYGRPVDRVPVPSHPTGTEPGLQTLRNWSGHVVRRQSRSTGCPRSQRRNQAWSRRLQQETSSQFSVPLTGKQSL